MSKINYDNLINMHETQNEGFSKEAYKLLQKFIPQSNTHKYEPSILVTFLNDIVPFLK